MSQKDSRQAGTGLEVTYHVYALILAGAVNYEAKFAVSTEFGVRSTHGDPSPGTEIWHVRERHQFRLAWHDLVSKAKWRKDTGHNQHKSTEGQTPACSFGRKWCMAHSYSICA